jgi:transposase
MASARSPPQDAVNSSRYYTLAQRVQCLTLQVEGFLSRDIEKKTGVKQSAQSRIKKRAFTRGYRPEQDPQILSQYIEDAPRSGRPKQISPATEQQLIESVRINRSGREKSSEVLAYECGISRSSALRILHTKGLTNVKPTRKPGLDRVQKAARLAFALKYEHWTLEDWKRIIWSDETSVLLGQRRGTVRIWRDTNEAFERSCIRNRWKGYTEFMFWGCFSWDKKGPCHIWTKETAHEYKESEKELTDLNTAFEPELKAQWELNTSMRRMNLRRRPPGTKPQ